MLTVTASEQACGASVTGVDLSVPLANDAIREIRQTWLANHVVAFPDQVLSDDDLERLTGYFGGCGDDPFFVPMQGRKHVVALTRRADETAPVFAQTWHSDWSFKERPPIGTCLYSLVVPPVGGDTDFINQTRALAEMPASLRQRLKGRNAIHSARGAYAPDGAYGEREKGSDRSMKILYSDEARKQFSHPFIKKHPETGVDTLHGCLGYIVGVEGMAEGEGRALVEELYAWQTREDFQYTHKWHEHMLVIWDNRTVLHKANAGYDGYARELHRTTIADQPSLYLSP